MSETNEGMNYMKFYTHCYFEPEGNELILVDKGGDETLIATFNEGLKGKLLISIDAVQFMVDAINSRLQTDKQVEEIVEAIVERQHDLTYEGVDKPDGSYDIYISKGLLTEILTKLFQK